MKLVAVTATGGALASAALAAEIVDVSARAVERAVTTAAGGHQLTNLNVWSPDSRWIVYDVRSADDKFDGTVIEQVEVATGEVQRLYTAKDGAGCAVVTYHPREPKVIFILGPDYPTPDWSYGASRRSGMIVDARTPGVARPLDAMNYAPPFAPGALRGGSHVHVFSPDGAWVSFTYEDEVLARLGTAAPGGAHDLNQRTIGVSVPAGPVRVASTHPRNHGGDYFSVIVTRTVNSPRPGSDEISRAFEEGWIGVNGYVRSDGSRQRRALAFLGNVATSDGRTLTEVFVADLPDDLTHAGSAPLGGTATTRPAPPAGVTQRRLTFTGERKFPGVAPSPRHWLRASPDGAQIAFLLRDEAGVAQLWSVSPNGGAPRQLTHGAGGVASTFTWSPDGRWLAHVSDGSVCLTEAATGQTRRLTARRTDDTAPLPHACVFSPDGKQIAFTRRSGGWSQIFTVSAVTD